jgi:WD40 repeat protein
MSSPKVFISYARKDGRELALKLHSTLTKAGYQAWLDTKIQDGASWSQAIEQAIDDCSTVLALMSPASYQSGICRAEHLRALRKEKRVVPLLTRSDTERPLYFEHLNYLDFSKVGGYTSALNTLLSELQTGQLVSLPKQYFQTRVTVPLLPNKLVKRPEEVERLRNAVIGDNEAGQSMQTALLGMGGLGKTVLAQELCHDQVVQDAFPDGVIWVTIGRQTDVLLEQMREVGKALQDEDSEAYDNPTAAANQLRTLLQNKAVLLLLVLDDVWNERDVEPFLVDAPRCRLLMTTRDSEIALSLGATQFKLALFSASQALRLLQKWAGRNDDPAFAKIAERLGFLPLALRIAGARISEGMKGDEWLQEFTHISEIKLGRRSDKPNENLRVCLDLSLDSLTEQERPLYYSLGIFPEDLSIPSTPIIRLWRYKERSLSDHDCLELLVTLARLSLLDYNQADKTISLHDLLYKYAQESLTDFPAAQNELLSSYNPDARPWFEIPHDGYLYHHLAYHLYKAGRTPELRRHLLDWNWLNAKLAATDINALVSDYAFLPNDTTLHLLRDTLRLSAHVLGPRKTELPSQLLGRLIAFDQADILALLEQARRSRNGLWFRPRTCDLTPPGACLVGTLTEPAGGINAVTITPDGGTVIFASGETKESSAEPAIKLWRVDEGGPLFTLCSGTVSVLTVSPDGSLLASVSDNRRISIWSLKLRNSQPVCSFESQADQIAALAFTVDSAHLMVVSETGDIQIWELVTPSLTQSFTLPEAFPRETFSNSKAIAVAVAPMGNRLFIGTGFMSADTLNEWSLDNHKLINHSRRDRFKDRFKELAVTPDADHLLCANVEIEVWNRTGNVYQLSRSLPGHGYIVSALAVTPDGNRAVSADYYELKVWDLRATHASPVPIGRGAYVSEVVIACNGKRAAALCNDGKLRLWDVEKTQLIFTIDLPDGEVVALGDSDDGSAIMLGSRKGLHFLNVADGRETCQIPSPVEGVCLAISPDGTQAFVVSEDKDLIVWEIKTQRIMHRLAAYFSVATGSIAVFPDGNRVVLSSDHSLTVWDLKSGQLVKTLIGHTWYVDTLAVGATAEGIRIVSGSRDKTVRIWDPDSSEPLLTLCGHTWDDENYLLFTDLSSTKWYGFCSI